MVKKYVTEDTTSGKLNPETAAASDIGFDPGGSGMTATEANAAIIEAYNNGGGGGTGGGSLAILDATSTVVGSASSLKFNDSDFTVTASTTAGRALVTVSAIQGVSVLDTSSTVVTTATSLKFDTGLTVTASTTGGRAVVTASGGGGSGAMTKVARYTSTTTDLDIPLADSDCTYILRGYIQSASAQYIQMRYTEDNFSTVESGAGHYQWDVQRNAASSGLTQLDATADDSIRITGGDWSISSPEGVALDLVIQGHDTTAQYTQVYGMFSMVGAGDLTIQHQVAGAEATAGGVGNVNGVRLFQATGSIIPDITLYKVDK